MHLITGDESGQIKLVGFDAGKKCESIKGTPPAGGKVLQLISPPGGRQDGAHAVTTLGWPRSFADVVAKSAPLVQPCVKISNRHLIPEARTTFVAGRRSGLVQQYVIRSDIDAENSAVVVQEDASRRFHMPSSVVYLNGCSPSANRFLCVCADGEAAIINWQAANHEEEVGQVFQESRSTCPSLQNGVFTPIPFAHLRKGRLAPSRRAKLSVSSLEKASPCPNVHLKDVFQNGIANAKGEASSMQVLPSWVETIFALPGPVDCAAMSERSNTHLAFGGNNNLLKVIDMEKTCAVFSAKNVEVNCLELAERVHIKTVAFMDQLSATNACIATGNANGRLYLYDHRIYGKPVLDVQICAPHRSICAIAPAPTVLWSFASQEGSGTPDSEGSSLQFSTINSRCLKKPLKPQESATQALALSDNHGTIYLYDIRATGRQCLHELHQNRSPVAEHQHESHRKKTKWDPAHFGMYPPGHTITPTPSNLSPLYEAACVRHLQGSVGAARSLSWSTECCYGADRKSDALELASVSVGRYANVWTLYSKPTHSYTIYLKNTLLTCLSYPAHTLPVTETASSVDMSQEENTLSEESADTADECLDFESEKSSVDDDEATLDELDAS